MFILIQLIFCGMLSAGAAEFPLPEFKNDFMTIFEAGGAYAKKHGKGQSMFRNVTLPFAPFDIAHGSSVDVGKLRQYRNFSFGALGRAFDADPRARSEEFFCPPDCWGKRGDQMRDGFPKILKLRDQFLKLDGARVVSQWNVPENFRVNDWFYSADNVLEAKASKNLGLISSGEWRDLKKSDLARAQQLRAKAKPIAKGLKELGFAAIMKATDGSTIVVADGFADNAWGLMILSEKAKAKFVKPPEDDWVQVQDGVWIFRKGGRSFLEI